MVYAENNKQQEVYELNITQRLPGARANTSNAIR